MGTIYLITNTTNGKCYVGKTEKVPNKRWREHCGGANGKSTLALHRAIRKYGESSFILETLASKVPSNEINTMERIWIFLLNSVAPNGYNMTLGGDGGTPTPEVRKKMTASVKKTWADPVRRKSWVAAVTKSLQTEEYREKQRIITKKRWDDPEERRVWEAKNGSPETRKKIKAASKRMWSTPEIRDKILSTLRSPESRKRLSEQTKQKWSDPEFRKRKIAGMQTPEYKKKQYESSKKRWANPEYHKRVAAKMRSSPHHKTGKQNGGKKLSLWLKAHVKVPLI